MKASSESGLCPRVIFTGGFLGECWGPLVLVVVLVLERSGAAQGSRGNPNTSRPERATAPSIEHWTRPVPPVPWTNERQQAGPRAPFDPRDGAGSRRYCFR